MAKWYVNTRNLWDVNQFGHGNFPSPRGIFLDIYYCWKEAHIVLDGKKNSSLCMKASANFLYTYVWLCFIWVQINCWIFACSANVLYTYVWLCFIWVQIICWIFCLLRLNIRVEPERDCICNLLNLSNKVKNHKELTEYLFPPYAIRGFLHSFECKEFISFGNNIGWAQEGGLWWFEIFNVGTYHDFLHQNTIGWVWNELVKL